MRWRRWLIGLGAAARSSLVIAQYSLEVVLAYMTHVQQNAERAVRDMLRRLSLRHQLAEVGTLHASDHMDDGTEIRLRLTVDRRDGSAVFDFSGTGPQVFGNINAPRSVTMSAVIYSVRCLVNEEIPLNQGCLNPIQVLCLSLLSLECEARVM